MEYTQSILQNIHNEIIKGTFNDLQIVCEDGLTTGSRLALSAMSQYFRIMLTCDMTESRTGILNLPFISMSVFKDILKMCFCGVNLINDDNCIQMLDAAEMMQLDHVKELCYNHLKEGLALTHENFLNWWRLMKRYNFHDLSDHAFGWFTDNLHSFVETKTVVLLSKEELLEIISKDDLKCKEDDVVKVVIKWIQTNNPHTDECTALFERLKLAIVDSDFLVNEVLSSDAIVENKLVKEMIHDVLASQVAPHQSNSRFNAIKGNVFVLQYNGKSLLSCFTSDDSWQDVLPAPEDPGDWYSAALLGNNIYITGGYKKPRCTLIYDKFNKIWQTGPDMKHGRRCHCMATANHKLYAIGGQFTSTIEELNDVDMIWKVAGDLQQGRALHFSVTVGHNILVIGGRMDETPSDDIQCFNTRTRSVSNLRSRLPCRSFALRGFVQLPDVFLLDNDGNVMHIQIIDQDGDIKIETVSTVKWKSFVYRYGVVHRKGKILCFNMNGISTFNIGEGREESNTFPIPPRCGYVFNVLSVCLQK